MIFKEKINDDINEVVPQVRHFWEASAIFESQWQSKSHDVPRRKRFYFGIYSDPLLRPAQTRAFN